MLRLLPLILVVLWPLVSYWLAVRRTKRMLDTQSTLLAVPELNAVMARLGAALDLPRVKVHVLEVPAINGLAALDGRIFITRGFLNAYSNGQITAPEMASVIAHELGHVALGHGRRRIFDFAGQNALRTALVMVLGRLVPGLGQMMAGLAATAFAARLSRGDEYEADAYATALMDKSGIGVAHQISMFHKLDRMTGGGSGQAAWLLSHPKTAQRIAAIEKNAAKWGLRIE
ncbi:Peptidase, M48 family, putative [Ketogulonicigenium robustum]|uniref:Peptidase, M48 family, putative n=1 Tax=Ketogulonicigenium robustum TaxID=92947 RepID=A0A1W6P0C6_9RHOB|nr:M48 family metallopeptidase [Ketogulonicigenium robustum]ARO14958.1 Peptidase, M48 family, putative [Ketogulonicigenium robustum]